MALEVVKIDQILMLIAETSFRSEEINADKYKLEMKQYHGLAYKWIFSKENSKRDFLLQCCRTL